MDGFRSGSMFCIVDFVGGRKRMVVPDSWLSVNDKLCLLPPNATESDLEALVRNLAEPGEGWQMLEVSSLETYDNYSEAKKQLEKKKERSQLDASSQRKRKKPSYLEDYTTHDSDDDGRSRPYTVFGTNFDEEAMSENEWIPPPEFNPRIKNVSSVRKTIRNERRPRNHRFSQSQLSSQKENIDITCDCQSSCHSTFLQALYSMQKQLDRTSQMVQQLLVGQNQTHSDQNKHKRILQSRPVNQMNGPEEMEDSSSFLQFVLEDESTSAAKKRTEDEASFSASENTNIAGDQLSNSEKMNIDKRGIKRGTCMVENCDCELYEYEKNIGPNCSYCSCPATKHQKIGVTEEMEEENSVLISSLENNDIQAKDSMKKNSILISRVENVNILDKNGIETKAGYTIQNLIPVSSDVEVFPTTNVFPSCSSSLQDLLPKKLPRAVEEALDKNALTPQLRNKIVRSIAEKCFEQGISSNVVNAVADLATQRWSPLKSRFGEPSATLALQIKRRISKLKLNSKDYKDSQVDVEEEEVHSFNQQQMTLEVEKRIPSQLKLKQFLDATRVIRKEKVNYMPALQVMKEYPALKIPDLLLWEFSKIMDMMVEEMIRCWKHFLDDMKEYLKETENFTPESESYEGLTLEILTKLPSLVPTDRRISDDTKFVLQIHEDNKTIHEVMPARDDPPRLIAIRDVAKTMTFFAYLNGTQVFTEKCPIKATLLLLATYWVFNIHFPPESKQAFHLISFAVLKDKIAGRKSLKCSGAVECLLKRLKL